MAERNWGMILGVMSGLVIFAVARFSGVSEETAFIRALMASLVGGFIGFGFNYLASSVMPDPAPTKGRGFDVTLPDAAPDERTLEATVPKPSDFVPVDLTQAARVVQQMGRED
ncbi:MAG TPA: hypothetical protein V6D05_16850 [Stenomitos sp.]